MKKRIKVIVAAMQLVLLFGSCQKNKGRVVEYHPNGVSKIIETHEDQNHRSSCVKQFSRTGKLISWGCRNDSSLVDVRIYYDTTESKTDTFLYFYKGDCKYKRLMDQSINALRESFYYDFKLLNDTIKANKNELEFEISLPLPSSILKNRDFFFAYQINPLQMRDSIIIDPKDSIKFRGDKIVRKKIMIDSLKPQLFYGHLTFYSPDNTETPSNIQYPVELEIYPELDAQ